MSRLAPSSRVPRGADFSIGIAAARFNESLINGLLDRVVAALHAAGVKENAIAIVRVPGDRKSVV